MLDLQQHLQKFPFHYQLWQHIHDCGTPASDDKTAFASRQKVLDEATLNWIIGNKSQNRNIANMFSRQTVCAMIVVFQYLYLLLLLGL